MIALLFGCEKMVVPIPVATSARMISSVVGSGGKCAREVASFFRAENHTPISDVSASRAARAAASVVKYAASGVRPSNAECGRAPL